MLQPLIMLIAGAVLLVKGADLLVDGGIGIALKSGVSPLVVGLTVVAFGTSAPELTVSLAAALQGAGDVSFGNVVGSNIANIALILGITAMINYVALNRALIRWELPFLMAITVITAAMGYLNFVTRGMGLVLLALFAVYLFHCFRSPSVVPEVESETASRRFGVLWLLVILGVAGLGVGGSIFVDGARSIARMLGVSEAIIGLTVVAVGTSLPELVTSAVAAVKNQADISVGNIVGSNIFNILLVIGASTVVRPYSVTPDPYMWYVGIPGMLVTTMLLFPFAIWGSRITRKAGLFLFVLYMATLALAVVMA